MAPASPRHDQHADHLLPPAVPARPRRPRQTLRMHRLHARRPAARSPRRRIGNPIRHGPLLSSIPREKMVKRFQDRFTKILVDNPLPKKPKNFRSGISSGVSSGAGTPTPEHNRLIIVRHGAVLGLGALIQAFPYNSPPPHWMPEALTSLSTRAANDPGIVGSSVKSIISEFKKTRQDTWHIDAKVSNAHSFIPPCPLPSFPSIAII